MKLNAFSINKMKKIPKNNEFLMEKQNNFHHVYNYNCCCYSVLQNTLFLIETYEYFCDNRDLSPYKFGVVVGIICLAKWTPLKISFTLYLQYFILNK